MAGEAGDGVEAVRRARQLRPDVVLMDVRMPRLNGIEATRQLLAEPGEPRLSTAGAAARTRSGHTPFAPFGPNGAVVTPVAFSSTAR